jgi:uncharacterized protein YegL
MPKLTDSNLEEHALPTGSFGYSAAKLEDLGATEYTLVTLVVDVSSSVSDYKKEMEDCIKEVIQACKMSPRADNLMIRLLVFNTQLDEIHGYKLLEQCNSGDYVDCLAPGGMTALYDAAENAVSASIDYAKKLTEADFDVNAIAIFITDGMDNRSKGSEGNVSKAIAEAKKIEALESLVSILVGVGVGGYPEVGQYLNKFQAGADITQYVEIAEANAKTLAKLAEFVSKSISAQSQSLGTGGPSAPISLNI